MRKPRDTQSEASTVALADADVIEIYDLMQSHNITLWIDGGWGVDALLGKQTRSHKDLDVAVQAKDIPRMRELLFSRGFLEKGEEHARPWNFLLIDDAGREIDLHIVELDSKGNGVYGTDNGENFTAHALSGSGTIGGRKVHCIAAEDAVRFHGGYRLKGAGLQRCIGTLRSLWDRVTCRVRALRNEQA